MSEDRWRRIRTLFERLAELPAERWRERLAEACGGDRELEREVLDLLIADADAAQPQERIARGVEAMAADTGERLAGMRLGPFRLLEPIGRGGMGAVWLAERADGQFAQRVAIKLVRSQWDENELHARFRAERQMLADLRHPNIASLIDGGVTADGKPWLALEYVDGVDLCRYAERQRLDLRQRVALFLTVCSAVTHAHARLIVHRDLKPSNILVRDDGMVKLLDFGIAKLIDAPAAQATAIRAFTPEYAAPEQIRGEPVTTAVDIYTLGLLLYELLTGRGPYALDRATPSAYERAALEQTPTRPSQAVARDAAEGANAAELAAQRRLTPQRLRRELRGDLDAIVLKALRKEPEQRYASVQDLAGDLRAWLQHRPVEARRGGWRYGAARFLRRHAFAASMGAVAAAALCGGLGVALWQAQQARLQRDVAVAEASKSRAVVDFMRGLFELADPDKARGEQVTARELLARGASDIRGRFEKQPEVRAELLAAMADAQRGLGLYADALPLAEEASRLGRELGADSIYRSAELNRVRSLLALARYDDALAALAPLRAASAEDAENAALRADAEYLRAQALRALNRFDEADAAYAQAYREQTRLHGAGDRRSQDVAMRYVALLVLRDRKQEAETLARATLAAVRERTGRRDPHLAEAIASLAVVLANNGPLSEAEALRREEVEIRRAAQGADHPDTVGALNNLAAVQYAQRRFAEAADTFAAVLAKRRAQFGDAHPLVATAASNLANCELELGRAGNGKRLAEEALRIRLAQYGPDHHTTAAALLTLGAAELDLGEYAAAERHLRESVRAYDKAMGAGSTHALAALRELTRAELLAGHADPQCVAAERAYAMAPPRANDAPKHAYLSAQRAACWLANGRREAASALAADLALLRKAWGEDDRRTRKVVALAQVAAR
ncbi:serine/threonine protein kinase [Luteimonas gilva]|uniref:Serine/threonine protein kinase n=1 Tax=Luteimonas gilva TaxID=2572684 RepID=A0A4U5JP51_9GAMM|nr:serine/threonine-protein kinase [Luteimonas gilva]TKR30158.1 serine/threonine protein kinase [Luteimonas gilva]